MKNDNTGRLGFTLIELLVVVLIIGILASVALPQYQKAVEKSRASEAWMILKAIQDAQDRKRLEEGAQNNYRFEELDVEFFDEGGGRKATGNDFATKNFLYTFPLSIREFDNLDFAVPQARPRGRSYSYELMMVGGRKYCFGRDCKKIIGFTTDGDKCSTGGGVYETQDCYVE